MKKVELRGYSKVTGISGRSIIVRGLWFVANAVLLASSWFPLSSFKLFLLKSFGATIGQGVVIKPRVNIKYPWKLTIGDHCWIGENVWIDNLDEVVLGSNVCISQGAYLLTGNHDYTSDTFDLITKKITIENGAWIAAKSIVGPGVTVKSHAILSVGSVTSKDLEPYGIYRGNPAQLVGKRNIT